MLSSSEALAKALVWRFAIAIPLGTLITYLWIGEVWRSITLMVFMNVVFTVLHYVYELSWPFLHKKFKHRIGH